MTSRMRRLRAGAALCLAIAGCGGGSSKMPSATNRTPVVSSGAATTAGQLPTAFEGGYAQAWGQLKEVGAEVAAAINQVKRARAKHRTVPDAEIAVEFAGIASRLEPAVVELQGLTPPPSVASAYRSLTTAAVGMSGALRNFSSDANANRTARGERDLASYFAYAATIDRAATTIYHKLGIK